MSEPRETGGGAAPLYELVYLSSSIPFDFPQVELDRILATSRAYNRAHDITGVLLYENGEFVQLLEGTEQAVKHLYYEKILKDPRHRGAFVAMEQPIEERSFSDWSMGFSRLAKLPHDPDLDLDGFLHRGLASLDMSGPESDGRRLLLAVHAQMRAR